MVRHGAHLWQKHPATSDLTFGERSADTLRARFGSWGFLGLLNLIFCAEVSVHIATHGRFDPGLLYLNLFLSWLAAQQGGALQIASNRGDRISAEVALHTQRNTDTLTGQSGEILALQQQQMTLLAGIEHANAELNLIRRAVAPAVPNPPAGTDPAPDPPPQTVLRPAAGREKP